MLPLRDTLRARRFPGVKVALIAANVGVFGYALGLGPQRETFLAAYALVPRTHALPTFLTSMFMHAGWSHILGNMLYLYIFGRNVEDRLGHTRFLLFYLVCGIVAGCAQVAVGPALTTPVVGASGAISGVTGAYLIFFPRARIVTLVPVFIFMHVVEIPAVFLLAGWFALQVAFGTGALAGQSGAAGIAFWAHIGGFLTGMILGPLLVGKGRRCSRRSV